MIMCLIARRRGSGRVSASFTANNDSELVENLDSSAASVAAEYLSASEQNAFSTPTNSSLKGMSDQHMPQQLSLALVNL